jgi:predicted O-methyltransferase YrrM
MASRNARFVEAIRLTPVHFAITMLWRTQMSSALRTIAQKAYHRYLRLRTPRFYKLKQQTNGMLNPMIYRKMYNLIYKLPDLDIVEIGGAAGSASIAMGLALKESGKSSHLLVIERCEGGSRVKYGGYQDNYKIITENFRRFDVEEKIILYPHEITLDTGKEAISFIKTTEIAAFLHDADGRLDRDFFLFWPLLRPGGLIIIDDYAKQGSYKHVITYDLLNQIIEWKLFNPAFKIRNTIFGYKPFDSDIRRLDLHVCSQLINKHQAMLA